MKSLQKEPQSAGINVQSSQSESTPRRLTLGFTQFRHTKSTNYVFCNILPFAKSKDQTHTKNLKNLENLKIPQITK